MLKRLGLFLLTNLLIVATISIVLNVLGVGHYLTSAGLDYQQLILFCLVWGMVGSFISLALSRIMAKMLMGVHVINPTSPGQFGALVAMVHDIAKRAQLPAMPEVGVYNSPEVNAFATGPTKSRALVAVSTGLLQSMSRDQMEGVLAHEVSHIQNGDMVTMTLLQGIVNAFVMFLSRVIAYAISQNSREESRPMVNFMVTMVLQILIGILGVMVVAAFSRHREFRADAGSAKLVGANKMRSALERLKQIAGGDDAVEDTAQSVATLKISGRSGGFWAALASHPPLEARIAALANVA